MKLYYGMKEKLKTYYDMIDFSLLKLSAVLVVLFYGINFTLEYVADTYSTFEESGTWEWMLYENGRIFNAAVYYIIEQLNIPGGYIYKLSYLLAIFCLTLAVYLFARLLNEFCTRKILCSIISFLTLCNFFFIEYFLFIEKGLFMLAILLCTCAAYFTISFFRQKKKSFLLISLFLLLWAVFIYQIILALYVILCLPFIIKYSSSLKDFIFYNCLVAFFYAVPLLSAFFIINFIFSSSRMGTVGNLFANIRNVIPELIAVTVKPWCHLPANVFLLSLLAILIFSVIIALCYAKNIPLKYTLPALAYVACGTVFTGFFPFISGVSDMICPRTLYPYACIFGIIAAHTVITYPADFKINFQPVLTIIISLILVYEYLNFSNIFIERYKANQCDRYLCEIIGSEIQKYENETGIEIETICFYPDKSITWYYPGCEEFYFSQRSQTTGWSNLTSLNLYLDRDFVKGERDPEYDNYFSQQDWNTYSEEQIIFEGNVLHLAVY